MVGRIRWFTLCSILVVTELVLSTACGGPAPVSPGPSPVPKPAATPKPTAEPKPPTESRRYAIKLDRPVTVGFRYRLTSVGKRDLNITMDGQSPKKETLRWDYEADVTVVAVDANGGAIAEDHKVIRLQVTRGTTTTTPLTNGVVVAATLKGTNEVFAVNNHAVSKQVAEILEQIVSLQKPGRANDDVLFGTSELKKVGDRWPINAATLAKSFNADFKGMPLPAHASNTTGALTLTRETLWGGVAGLSFNLVLRMTDVAPKMGTIKPTSGTIEVTMNAWLPADPTSVQRRRDTTTMMMHLEGTMGAVKIVVDMTSDVTETKRALP